MSLTLFTLLGYPGSGKTAFAKQLSERYEITRVSYDELRNKMWTNDEPMKVGNRSMYVIPALDYAVERLLNANISVMYDVNSNTRKQRASTIELAISNHAKPITLWVKTSLGIARERERARKLDENKRMTNDKFQRLVDEFEDPGESEMVIAIDGGVSFTEQLALFEAQLSRFDLLPKRR